MYRGMYRANRLDESSSRYVGFTSGAPLDHARFTAKCGHFGCLEITGWHSSLRQWLVQAVEAVHMQTAKASRRGRP